MLVVQNQNAPRLSLGQIMAISKSQGLVPRIKGWVQGTTHKLPDCPRCGTVVRFDEPTQDYVCDSCDLDEGIVRGPVVRQVAQKNLITRDFWSLGLADDYTLLGIDNNGIQTGQSGLLFDISKALGS